MASENQANQETVRGKNVELITLNEFIPRYEGFCSIAIHDFSKQLIIEPYDEKFKMITASFEWNFFLEENILFVETPGNFLNFALVCHNIASIQKAFAYISLNKELNYPNLRQMFKEKCFIPMLGGLKDGEICRIVDKFMNDCSNDLRKKEFQEIIREKFSSQNLLIQENEVEQVEEENKTNLLSTRKRTYQSISASAIEEAASGSVLNEANSLSTRKRTYQSISTSEAVASRTEEATHNNLTQNTRRRMRKQSAQYNFSNFKLLTYNIGKLRQRLTLFDDKNDKTRCHIFNWNEAKNVFECYNCHKRNMALFRTGNICTAEIKEANLDGEEYVETERFHKCRMIKFRPFRGAKRIKIFKPDYEFSEAMVNGQKRGRLIIFDKADRKFCFEYSLKSGRDVYDCCGCTKVRKCTRAKMFFENSPKEYVEIYSDDHKCQRRPYSAQLIENGEEKIVRKPNFEFQNVMFRGKETQKLIIFDDKDRHFCYELCYEKPRYICRRCIKKKQLVYAYVEKDCKNAVEFLRLGPNPHICGHKPYISEEERKDQIIDAKNFKLFPSDKKKGTFDIFIFTDNTDKKMCHEFSYSSKCYNCVGCRKKSHHYAIKLCQNSASNEWHIAVKNCQMHVCKPKKFKTDAASESPKPSSNFILYQNENKTKKMIVFTSDAKNLCHDYLLDRTIFRCNKCAKLKKHVSAKISCINNVTTLQLGPMAHVCKALEFSAVENSIIKTLGYFDIFPAKEESGSELLKKFELRANKKNVKDSILIVFHPKKQNFCYEFHLLQSINRYRCINCEKLKSRVSATLSKNAVIMGEKQHICKPLKYEPEKPKFKNFKILHQHDARKVTKLIVFTSEAKNFCYEYRQENLHFLCNGCSTKKSYAKVLKDFDGTEYIDFYSEEHTCKPKKFDPKKYDSNPIIAKSQFEIFPNTRKNPDSKIIIFKNEGTRKFGYEFCKDKTGNTFYCYQCHKFHNKSIYTKLITSENAEIFIEHSKTGHACSAVNFHQEGHFYSASNYELKLESDGRKFLKTFSSRDKKFYYKFKFDDELQVFYCISCELRNRFVSGKIIENGEGGNSSCFLQAYDHVCSPLFF